MFKKLLASVGIGSASVDLEVANPRAELDGTLEGQVHIKGGNIEQEINQIYINLVLSSKYKHGDESTTPTTTTAQPSPAPTANIDPYLNATTDDVNYKLISKRVNISLQDKAIKLWINKLGAQVGAGTKAMDVAPVVTNGRTMIPLRFVTENLGAQVTWNSTSREITIKYQK